MRVTPPHLVVAALCVTLLAGCGGDEKPRAGEAPAGRCQDTGASLRAAVERHVAHVDRTGPEAGATSIDIDICRTAAHAATATITVRGQLDDSVRDARHRLALSASGNRWRIVRDVHTYRCQPGRGQQVFRRALCV